MEERIIDDEYGRGVRMKKTKDGYVDVTDELAEVDAEEAQAEDEVAFEFPLLETDEDDETLAGLTPEEAMALIRQREEEAQKRKEAYEKACADGEILLAEGNFAEAERVYEKALGLDQIALDASVGYWRAKTENFQKADVLVAEYADSSIESLEFDLGYEATMRIRKEYANELQARYDEICAEEATLAERVESKQAKRREIIGARLKKATTGFVCATVPALALLVLTIVFGLKMFSTPDNTFVLPTILLGVAFFVAFIVFMVFTNKWINVLRIRRANEKLTSTEDGTRLQKLRDYKVIYEALLAQK